MVVVLMSEVNVHIEGKWYGLKATVKITIVTDKGTPVSESNVFRAFQVDKLERKIDDFLLQRGIDW